VGVRVAGFGQGGLVPFLLQYFFIMSLGAGFFFGGDCAFFTWLFGIAVNTAKKYLVALGRGPHSCVVAGF
ncbi:hypothetical protein ACQWKP_24345, partial [Salmonella enterica subsp. enterica serovar Infantis]